MMEDSKTHCMYLLVVKVGCYMADYMKGCDLCNCMKTFPVSPIRKLMPNQITDCHWQVILVDLKQNYP